MEVDVGEVLVGEEVEGLGGAVGGEVLGGCCAGSGREEEGRENDLGDERAAHGHCKEFTAGPMVSGCFSYGVMGMTP